VVVVLVLVLFYLAIDDVSLDNDLIVILGSLFLGLFLSLLRGSMGLLLLSLLGRKGFLLLGLLLSVRAVASIPLYLLRLVAMFMGFRSMIMALVPILTPDLVFNIGRR
jgi:hypothetical protein